LRDSENRLFYRALLQKRPKIRYLSIENPQIRKPRIVVKLSLFEGLCLNTHYEENKRNKERKK